MVNLSSPTVSVVVPCRNERLYIEACVRSIFSQEAPPGGFEVIIVDGRSDDGTRTVLNQLEREFPSLRIVDNPRQITPCAMNAGIQAARGSYIAIMGAHNRYAHNYLLEAWKILDSMPVDNVGGALMCEGSTLVQRAIGIAHHSKFSVGGANWHNQFYEGPADTVFGGVYRREVFDRVGLFDEDLVRNQDDEFNLRLIKDGGKIWQSPKIKSWYQPRSSLKDLFAQYMQYGYWKVRIIQKHKLPASIRHIVPSVFVFTLLLLMILSPWSYWAAWSFAAIVCMYVLANIGASVINAARWGWKFLPLLPFVFASYHFAYGMGFWVGIWHFILGRKKSFKKFSNITRPSNCC